jgi:hypothetical protein
MQIGEGERASPVAGGPEAGGAVGGGRQPAARRGWKAADGVKEVRGGRLPTAQEVPQGRGSGGRSIQNGGDGWGLATGKVGLDFGKTRGTIGGRRACTGAEEGLFLRGVRRTPSPGPSRRLPPPLARRCRQGRRWGRVGDLSRVGDGDDRGSGEVQSRGGGVRLGAIGFRVGRVGIRKEGSE